MQRVSSTASENIDFIENSDGKKDYNVSRSRVMGLINWAHVFKLYLPVVFGLIVAIVAVQITTKLHLHGFDLNVC